MSQFIYTMKGLGKIYPPDSVVFQDIWLSFLYGAKIGVIGSNGSGKSTLLRIMAGHRHGVSGRGAAVGGLHRRACCRRSRCSIPTKDVFGNVDEGVAPDARAPHEIRRDQREVRRRHVPRGHGQADGGAGARAGRDRSRRRLGPRLQTRTRDGRAAPAAGRRRRHQALRRREAARRAVPAAAPVAGHAAARRADEPSRRRVGRLARAVPEGIQRLGRRHHARPLLSRQRRQLDPRTRSHARRSRGKATIPAGSTRSSSGSRSRRSPRANASARCSASWSGFACRRAPARRRARRASTPTNNCSPRTRPTGSTASKSTFRPARASATSSSKRAMCARATAMTCC